MLSIHLSFIIGSIFLGGLAFIDYFTYNKKGGYIPSMLTTLFLILGFLFGYPESISSGILALLIGLLLTDLDYWGGIADLKAFVGAGMLFPNLQLFCIFAGSMTIIGLIYKLIWKKALKNKKENVPFIPVIFISFIITLFTIILLFY